MNLSYVFSLQKANIPVTEGQLDTLVDLMDYDGNNEIDLRYCKMSICH